MPLSLKAKCGIVTAVGILLLGPGIFMLYYMPSMIESQIAKPELEPPVAARVDFSDQDTVPFESEKLALNNGSESYATWQKAPLPVSFKVNLFHVVNSAEVLNGAKPIVEEMGPYGFLQTREKFGIDFDDDNDTVTFQQRKTYVFSPELSNGTLNDTITTVNVPLLAIAKQAQYLSGMSKFMLNMMLQLYKAKPFVTKTVGQMLFEGYFDPLSEAISKAQKRVVLPNNTFGFFYGQNATSDGIYTILRGNKDIESFTSIVTYNNASTLTAWNTTYCNMINGTDGAQYPPHVTPDITPRMFTSDLCRSLYLRYNMDSIVKGIKLLRYTPSPELLGSVEINPDNACYCSGGNCLLSGVMNISACKSGAPIIVSLPHFFQADPHYIYGVDGLHPEQDLHETFLDIEPYTGIVMNAAKRLQMNADFGPCKGIVGFEKLNPVFLPLFWVFEGAGINDESADKFKSQLMRPIMLGTAVTYALIGIGAFMLLCVSILWLKMCFPQKNEDVPSAIDRSERSGVSNDYEEAVSRKLLETNGNTVNA